MSSVLRFDEWQDSEGNTVYDGATGGLIAPGLVAVKSVLKTDTFTASVSGGGNVAVTDLSITHEVSDPANKLIITAFFGAAANSEGRGQVGLAVNDGSGFIQIGDNRGSDSSRVSAGGWTTRSDPSSLVVTMPNITINYSPGVTTSKTYTVHAINTRKDTYTLYVNRNERTASDQADVAAVSAIHIMEVAV